MSAAALAPSSSSAATVLNFTPLQNATTVSEITCRVCEIARVLNTRGYGLHLDEDHKLHLVFEDIMKARPISVSNRDLYEKITSLWKIDLPLSADKTPGHTAAKRACMALPTLMSEVDTEKLAIEKGFIPPLIEKIESILKRTIEQIDPVKIRNDLVFAPSHLGTFSYTLYLNRIVVAKENSWFYTDKFHEILNKTQSNFLDAMSRYFHTIRDTPFTEADSFSIRMIAKNGTTGRSWVRDCITNKDIHDPIPSRVTYTYVHAVGEPLPAVAK